MTSDMINEAVQFVWEQVERFLRGDAGRGFDIGKAASFETLLYAVRTQDRGQLATLAEDAYRLVAAMCLLGPGAAGAPPAVVREPLLDLAQRFEPDESQRGARAMEFAIAYGCGWRRQLRLARRRLGAMLAQRRAGLEPRVGARGDASPLMARGARRQLSARRRP